jgi:GT2 family glycosyltransferase
MSKNRKRKQKNISSVDIALLTCGLVDLGVFEKCVSAISREAKPTGARLYVIFNGVEKDTRGALENIVSSVENVSIKHSPERLGFSAAANRVIRQGNSPLALFITDDIILNEGALEKLLHRMKDPQIGMCGLKLMFPKDSIDPARPAGRVQHIGHGIDIRGEIVHPLMGWKPENPKCNVSREVQSVTGGVFMIRRDAFLKAGGFQEIYGLGYYEDVDLCFSIRQLGYKVFIDTSATADHVTNASYVKSEKKPSLETNKMIFRQRWGGLMQSDSWSFW